MCSEDLYVSNFYGLSLKEYVYARSLLCKAEHSLCSACPPMLLIAESVIADGHCRLSESFKKAFPSLSYKTDIARRKVLQMPLVCIRLRDEWGQFVWYIFEHIKGTNYQQFAHFAQTMVLGTRKFSKPEIQKEEVKALLQLAQSDRERELVRYSLYKASGISSTAARRLFGFENMVFREKSVQEAIKDMHAIHEAVDELSSLQNKALLQSLGLGAL